MTEDTAKRTNVKCPLPCYPCDPVRYVTRGCAARSIGYNAFIAITEASRQ